MNEPAPRDSTESPYRSLVQMVEDLYQEHGDTNRGLGYPKNEGFDARYQVYLDIVPPKNGQSHYTLLDVGCGTGRLLDLIEASNRGDISYRGVDLSPVLVEAARKKHPQSDILCGDPFDLSELWEARPDYIVFGGIFTCRLQMSESDFTAYMLRLLRLAFRGCRRGVAFNVMSQHVDWQRDDLFHVPFDRMADLLQAHFSRHYLFRADYGLYEYTVYLYPKATLG